MPWSFFQHLAIKSWNLANTTYTIKIAKVGSKSCQILNNRKRIAKNVEISQICLHCPPLADRPKDVKNVLTWHKITSHPTQTSWKTRF